MAAQFLLTAK